MVLDYCPKYCTYHPSSSYIFPKCGYCEGMLKLSVAADMIDLTVQEDRIISNSSCWDLWNVTSRLSAAIRFLPLIASGQGELKAQRLEFWVSKVAFWCARHISSSDCVMLEGTSGAHVLPFLISSGHGWFVGAAPGCDSLGLLCHPQHGKGCEAPGCSQLGCPKGKPGWGWGGLAPRLQWGTGELAPSPGIALQGPYVSRHLSSLSLYFNLRQGYYIHSSWGIVSINNLMAILYPSCVEVRDARLCKYLDVCVRTQVFCSPSILEKKWPFFSCH